MKKSSAGEGKIFFLDFTFNPALRTLQQNECVQQLRKKQSDVLALLCAKFPAPVSQADFLKEVWGGGYVTSQSIAQMIRSLRLCLKDESKNIIVTIPKLGYQLAVEPTWEAQTHDKKGLVKPPPGIVELENISFASQQLIQLSPSCSTALAVIPRDIADERVNAKRVKPRKWFISTVAAFCLSLISVAMSARSDPLSIINERSDSFSSQLHIPDKSVALSRVVYCCNVTSFRLCQQKADRFSGTCSLQLNQTLLN